MSSTPPEEDAKMAEEVRKLKAQVSRLQSELATVEAAATKKPPPSGATQAGFKPKTRDLYPRTTMVLFGADGNLATKKTFPSLFSLWRKHYLPRSLWIVGYARAEMTEKQFRKMVYASIYDSAHLEKDRKSFVDRCHYVSGQFDDVTHFETRLKPLLDELEKSRDVSAPLSPPPPHHQHNNNMWDAPPPLSSSTNGLREESSSSSSSASHDELEKERLRLYYMAVPPFVYSSICRALEAAQMRSDGIHRFVLEKPFGKDLDSFRDMCDELGELIHEDEAYRIDHYLGKELVMNVLVLRFANVCFEAVWSRFHIARVEICCLEKIGTNGRGGYFDEYGIIRDVMQNHLAQIMALIAMEQPLSFAAEDIRREKVKVLRSVRPLEIDNLVVGQYDGYAEDPTVKNKRSITETFASAKLFVDNPRWAGVPFILTAGKAVSQNKVEVRIFFHKVPGAIEECRNLDENELVVRVQPDECIYWRVQNRVPGLSPKVVFENRRMNLLYTPKESKDMPEAYERLLLEVLRGDSTNFVSVEELDAAWTIFSPALHALTERNRRPEFYDFGSAGPDKRRLFSKPSYDDTYPYSREKNRSVRAPATSAPADHPPSLYHSDR